MSDYTAKQAVRAFNRLWGPIADSMYESEMVDRHFDGGEWSGPAHARLQEDQRTVVAEYVSARMGVSVRDIQCQFDDNCYRYCPNW